MLYLGLHSYNDVSSGKVPYHIYLDRSAQVYYFLFADLLVISEYCDPFCPTSQRMKIDEKSWQIIKKQLDQLCPVTAS